MVRHAPPASLGLLLLCCLAPDAGARGTPLSVRLTSRGYEQLAHKRGVRVYRDSRARVPGIGAEGIFPMPPDVLLATLVDFRRHVGRIAHVAESRILKRQGQWQLVYQRLDLPLISDRDFTLWVRWGRDKQTRWVEFHAVPYGPATRRGVVRVRHHVGNWELRPIHNGKATLARYQVSIDLAGYLPGWMARSGAGKEIPALFAAISSLAAGTRPRACSTPRSRVAPPLRAR